MSLSCHCVLAKGSAKLSAQPGVAVLATRMILGPSTQHLGPSQLLTSRAKMLNWSPSLPDHPRQVSGSYCHSARALVGKKLPGRAEHRGGTLKTVVLASSSVWIVCFRSSSWPCLLHSTVTATLQSGRGHALQRQSPA